MGKITRFSESELAKALGGRIKKTKKDVVSGHSTVTNQQRLRDFRPGLPQTGLLNHRRRLVA